MLVKYSTKMRLLVLSSKTGGGHEIRAQAIQEFCYSLKIETLIETITTKINDTEVILSEKDQEIILMYLDSKKISLPYKLSIDDSLQRGDIIVRTGSVEVKEIVEKKIKFSQSANVKEEVEKIKKEKNQNNYSTQKEN